MRACGDLRVLFASAQANLARLRREALAATGQVRSRPAKHAIAVTTIDLLNSWSGFSRSYALSCVTAPRRRKGGRVRITQTGLDFNAVIGVAMKRHKPKLTPRPDGSWHRRDEPPWHDINVLTNCCRDLGCSHIADVEAAVSLQSRAFVDLPIFRNFFAHRNKGTAQAACAIAPHYSIPSYCHPLQILASTPKGRPYPLLVDWIDDIAITVELLCD